MTNLALLAWSLWMIVWFHFVLPPAPQCEDDEDGCDVIFAVDGLGTATQEI